MPGLAAAMGNTRCWSLEMHLRSKREKENSRISIEQAYGISASAADRKELDVIKALHGERQSWKPPQSNRTQKGMSKGVSWADIRSLCDGEDAEATPDPFSSPNDRTGPPATRGGPSHSPPATNRPAFVSPTLAPAQRLLRTGSSGRLGTSVTPTDSPVHSRKVNFPTDVSVAAAEAEMGVPPHRRPSVITPLIRGLSSFDHGGDVSRGGSTSPMALPRDAHNRRWRESGSFTMSRSSSFSATSPSITPKFGAESWESARDRSPLRRQDPRRGSMSPVARSRGGSSVPRARPAMPSPSPTASARGLCAPRLPDAAKSPVRLDPLGARRLPSELSPAHLAEPSPVMRGGSPPKALAGSPARGQGVPRGQEDGMVRSVSWEDQRLARGGEKRRDLSPLHRVDDQEEVVGLEGRGPRRRPPPPPALSAAC